MGCIYDNVTLYDGSSANSPWLGAFCTTAPPKIATTGPSLFVEFLSDESINEGGFSLTWSFVQSTQAG